MKLLIHGVCMAWGIINKVLSFSSFMSSLHPCSGLIQATEELWCLMAAHSLLQVMKAQRGQAGTAHNPTAIRKGFSSHLYVSKGLPGWCGTLGWYDWGGIETSKACSLHALCLIWLSWLSCVCFIRSSVHESLYESVFYLLSVETPIRQL